MKSKIEIRLKSLTSRQKSVKESLKEFEDMPLNAEILILKYEDVYIDAYIDSLKWVLNNIDNSKNSHINTFNPEDEHLFSNGG